MYHLGVLYNSCTKTQKKPTVGRSSQNIVTCVVYMLGAKHGFGQSMDGTAQSVDPCFVLQSMDCPLIPWIAQTEGRKAWIQAIHGLN